MAIDTPIPLDLPFKGNRTYLHGSDIVPALLAITGPVTQASFQFHRMATLPLCAVRVDADRLALLRQQQALFSMMSYRDSLAGAGLIAVLENGVAPAPARVAQDESVIVDAARWEENSITHATPEQASFTERLLALNKALLNRLAGRSAWVFSRLDLAAAPVDPASITVRFARAMGPQVCKSTVIGDGQPLGSLFFTRSAA